MTDPVEIVGKSLIICVCVVMLLPTSVWGKTVTADPAAGLQAAIDAAATGDTVYVPAGSWTLTGTVFINKSLTVDGFGSAITGNLTTPLIQITGPTGGAVQGVHIKLLRFQNGTSGADIYFNPATDSSVSDCWFTGGASTILIYNLSERILITRNFMTGLTGNAVFSGGADAGGTSSDIVLSGNTIQNTQNSAGPPGDIEFNDTINSVIANNIILNMLTLTGSYAIQVFPNHAGGPGIPGTVSNALVRGNVIRGIAGSQTGIALQGSSCTSPGCGTYKNIRIEGNAIDGFVTAVSYDTRNSSSTINNAVGVSIVANNISNSSGAAVWVQDSTPPATPGPFVDLHVVGNDIVGPSTGTSFGIRVTNLQGVTVEHNRVSNNTQSGVSLENTTFGLVSGNFCNNNSQFGIIVSGDSNHVVTNYATSNTAGQIQNNGTNTLLGLNQSLTQ